MTTNCPTCHQPLKRSFGGGGMSAGFPEGSVVLMCQVCRKFGLEGSDKWVEGKGNWRELLRGLAGNVKADQDAVKMAMETDIRDPRWEEVEM